MSQPQSFTERVAEARRNISEITVGEAYRRQLDGAVLIDVRESTEHQDGIAAGAIPLSRGLLEGAIGARVPDVETELVLYCAGGARSALAAESLQQMGYRNVHSMVAGFAGWKAASLPWAVPAGMNETQRSRYQRHITLPEIGETGQQRLLDSTVLVVGAGGLGSPALVYLAAAGVGTIVLVDNDSVDASNLQRQVVHSTDRIGMPKVLSAQMTIGSLNPDVTVEGHDERLTAANVLDLIKGVDVIVDGADNFPTRYLLNDASILTGTPVVHGSIFRFEGQVAVFDPTRGPCYRCLFPEPPPPELAPNCAEAGVLGVLPGVIGAMQAVETIKLLLDIGEPLVGSLLTYDALDQRVLRLDVPKRHDCMACSDPDLPPVLVDYDETCAAVSPQPGS